MDDAQIRAERILDEMQKNRDFLTLREMNGLRCGSRQVISLRFLQTTQAASSYQRGRPKRRSGVRKDN